MNQWLSKVAIFTIGAAVGSVVTWRIVKRKFERIAQEEIDSVKEAFLDRREEEEEAQQMAKEYAEVIQNYIPVEEKPGPVKVDRVEPYVISPEMWGEADYEMISLTYYADGVLEDFNGYVIKDIEEVVGPDAIGSIGEYQEDVIHVRDDDNKKDYEIVRDSRKYIDAVSKGTPFEESEDE